LLLENHRPLHGYENGQKEIERKGGNKREESRQRATQEKKNGREHCTEGIEKCRGMKVLQPRFNAFGNSILYPNSLRLSWFH